MGRRNPQPGHDKGFLRYRYGDVYYQTQGGWGTIKQFVSQWKIKDGVAEATD